MARYLSPKQKHDIIYRYEHSHYHHIAECYSEYSHAKAKAMRYCENLMDEMNGYDLRIIGHNTTTFSAAFQFIDPETGVLSIMYITKDYDTPIDYVFHF